MKTTLAVLVLVFAGLAISAQETTTTKPAAQAPPADTAEKVAKIEEPMAVCDLGIEHSPIISSLKLGMPEAEASVKVDKAFEGDASGVKKVSVKVNKNPVLDGVQAAALSTVGGKVTSIKLTLDQTFPNVKDFIQNIAPKLGVVRIGFRVDREKNEATMVCKEFTVDLKTTATGSDVTLVDITGAKSAKN